MKTVNKLFLGFATLFILTVVGCAKDEVETTGNIYGIVIDSKTREPIAGARVTLNPSGNAANTGNDGIYEFNQLEPGQYTIQISKDGYTTDTKRVTVVAGRQESGDMTLTTKSTE